MCLLIASTQWRRRLCNIALVPSIAQRIQTVRINHRPKRKTAAKVPIAPVMLREIPRVMFHSTIESCW